MEKIENYALYIRSEFQKSDDKRDAGLTTPDTIIRYDDIVYDSDLKWNLLDVYRPKDQEGKKLPVIVNVHGGGMVYGTKETYQFYCMSLAEHGFAVVNANYRLAPEVPFPGQIEDICKVFSWVLNHGDEYGFDLHNVFGVGDSAGGTLLGQFCNLCTNPDYQAVMSTCKVPEGFVPNAVALNCGDYEYQVKKETTESDGVIIGSLLPYIFPQGGTAEEIRKANVTQNVTTNFPPTMLMTSQEDFLKEQFIKLADVFIHKNVPFNAQFYVDEKEKPSHVFHCNMKSKLAKFCNDEQIRYFRLYLK